MSAQPAYQNSQAEKFAFYRRRDHANIEAMQNYVIALITEKTGIEMPANARHLYSAIQGAHGGGWVKFEEFERDFLSIGRQLQFSGSDDTIRARVRSWLDALEAWQFSVGFALLTINRGGQVIGHNQDGTPIRKKTSFIDHLKPVADDGIQRAQKTPLWKEHPGRALDAQAASVLAELPKLGTREESNAKIKKDGAKLPLSDYEKRGEENILKVIETYADGIELRGGDDSLWLEKLEAEISRVRNSRRKTKRARTDYATLSAIEEEEAAEAAAQEAQANATAYKGDKKTVHSARLGDENLTQAFNEYGPSNEVFDDKKTDSPLTWALFWASQGIPVIPLHAVFDDVCTCPCNKYCVDGEHKCGSECESKGKHPIARLVKKGAENATTDPETIKKWWTDKPGANVGGVMKGEHRLLGFDVDPRNGGDASMHDLIEAYGEEWAQTLRNKTGSGGFHLFFTVPEGVDFEKVKKLYPGIDLKWKNGILVLPPSVHVSGNSYQVIDPQPIRQAPDFLLEELTRQPDQAPPKVVNFQERKERLSTDSSTKERFADGERNNGLFAFGYGRWVNGWAADATELHAQLSEENEWRCVPPLSGAEVAKMASHIAADYARGDLRGGAA